MNDNFVLIGMSGAGKSALGKRMAARHHYNFIDTDTVILETYSGMTLQNILAKIGEEAFLKCEEEIVLALSNIKRGIISPGGSIIYSDRAMRHLSKLGAIVHIDVPLPRLLSRVDVKHRGIIGLREHTFAELFNERRPLYEKYAQFTFVPDDHSPDEIAQSLARYLNLE